MGYYIDLEKISIDTYKNKLARAYLPPSRKVLRDMREERFGYFKSIGISNVKELMQLLKDKDQMAELSKVDCLEANYLAILLRELNSTLPKPTRLKDFKGIAEETVNALEKLKIKNTVKLYDKVLTPESRKKLANETGINENEILKLTKLTDLSRIKWTGATFACMLYDLGYDSVEKASKADPEELHKQVNQISKDQAIYKGHIGLNDIRIFIEAAGEVSLEIVY